jgi:hypothetical protein
MAERELDPGKLLRALPAGLREARHLAVRQRHDGERHEDGAGSARGAWSFPPADLRFLTSRETIEQVRERQGDPAVPMLSRWLFVLLLLRVNGGAFQQVAWSRQQKQAAIRLRRPEPRELSLHAAIEVLFSTDRALREDALVGLAAAGSPLADAVVSAAERSQEIARRAGFAHLDDVYSPLAVADRDGLADELTRASHGLATDLLGAGDSLSGVLPRVLGLGLAAPFPRHLGPAWLMGLFPRETRLFDTAGLDLGTTLPKALASSSCTRLLARLGARYADASSANEVLAPFAQTPTETRRRVHGALFAGLLHSPVFLRKALGFSAQETARAMRTFALSSLAHVRLTAAKVLAREALLSGHAQAAREAASDRVAQALYTEVPRGLALVLPRPRLTDPGSFVALLLAASSTERMEQSFDLDWFRNPKAFEYLQDGLARAEEPLVKVDDARLGIPILIERWSSWLG